MNIIFLIKSLSKINTTKVILYSVTFLIFFSYFPSIFIQYYFKYNIGGSKILNELSGVRLLFFISILGPAIETIFQIIIIKIFYKFTKNISISIFIQAIFFSLNHSYSIIYIIITFIGGLIFGLLYFIANEKKQIPFLPMFLVHALYNLTVFSINELILN